MQVYLDVLMYITGKCLNCHYNTTGERCDRCLDGFQGDPLKNIPCVPKGKQNMM